MHTVIRRYQGVRDTAEVARRAVEEFAPQLRDQPGFQGYWVVDAGDGVLATISAFDTEEAAAASSAAAASWVQQNVGPLVPNPPQLTSGATSGVMAEVPA
jgi:heme-degrading monooxygenase HmoA